MKPTKEYNGRSRIRMYHCDCMELMKTGTWDLAIVDPPYGIGESNKFESRYVPTKKWANPVCNHVHKEWDDEKPNKEYFEGLSNNSKNQIIWGGNYFVNYLKPTMGWIFWDKKMSGDFSDGELAYTSYNRALKKFEWLWSGFKQKKYEKRIHPTQKPVALYKWLLTNYAKEGDTILDTHGGSMSIAIACWDLGFDLDVCELDEDYFNDAVKRFENHISQTQLF